MEIETTRFGRLSVDDERIITFPRGLLGLPRPHALRADPDGRGELLLLAPVGRRAEPRVRRHRPEIFFKDYEVPVREETQAGPAARPTRASCRCFVICNKVGEWLTGNLLGPIVVNAQNRLAQQVVLTEKKWTTRQPLMKLQAEVPLAKSA